MIKALVVGASGYSGAELVKILALHPEVEIAAISSTTLAGTPISAVYPNLMGLADLDFIEYSPEAAAEVDIAFLALPHGRAMALAPDILAAGAKVIDLSGDFRLPPRLYEEWYKQAHATPDLASKAVYGLCELNREAIKNAWLISNPGCYPTAVVLGLAPLAAAGCLGRRPVAATCLSGATGAGRAAGEAVHFCRVNENARAYKVGGVHQHVPEIEQELKRLGATAKVAFTPVLSSFNRGIYAILTIDPEVEQTPEELQAKFDRFYETEDFVKVLPPKETPQVKATAGSNYCHIGVTVDKHSGRIVVISALDNLVKGAAGQAVQNMNIIFGLAESTGLRQPGLYP